MTDQQYRNNATIRHLPALLCSPMYLGIVPMPYAINAGALDVVNANVNV